jgi:hypothetical protein
MSRDILLGIVLTLGGMGRRERIRSQKVIRFEFKLPPRARAMSMIRNGTAEVTAVLSPVKALLLLLLLIFRQLG